MLGLLSNLGGVRVLYRWIRDGHRPAPAPTAVEVGPGRWLHGRSPAVAASDKAWWGIWGKAQSTRLLSEDWLQHLRDLPPFPAYQPLTGEQIRRVIRAYNGAKAAGPDGWQVKELKQWQGPLLDWVTELVASVEAAGRWPHELSRGETVLLPKGGSADSLDRRPIKLLPILYQIWAAMRATYVRGCNRHRPWSPAGLAPY